MTPHHQHALRPIWCALLGLGSILIGCPNITPSEVVITNVEVKGDVKDKSFQLVLSGHGFGLSSVRYDFSKGTGTSSTSGYTMELLDRFATRAILVGGNKLTVLSTTRIEVQVDLDAPLRGGLYSPYDVVLHMGDRAPVFRMGAVNVIDADGGQDAGAPADDAAEVPDSGDAGDPTMDI